jgi:predicted alpha/beta hydrolase family esterase
MKNAFIIHGSYGHPKENWFPWLKNELEKLNYKVFVPAFPTPQNQSLASWFKTF